MNYTIISPICITEALCEKHFAPAFDRLTKDDQTTAFASLLSDLKQGFSTWYHINIDQKNLHFVTRINGDELVIDAIAGQGMSLAAEDIISKARAMGYRSIGFETRKPGMSRILAAFGFELVETFEDGSTFYRKQL